MIVEVPDVWSQDFIRTQRSPLSNNNNYYFFYYCYYHCCCNYYC